MSYNPCGNDWWCLLTGGEGTGRNAGAKSQQPTSRFTPAPTPTSRFPNGVKRATPPPPAPKKVNAPSGGSSGTQNTYQGLKDLGYKITGTSPKTGTTTLDRPSGGGGGGGCEIFDLPCHFKGFDFGLDKFGIKDEHAPFVIAGLLGLVVLFIIKR